MDPFVEKFLNNHRKETASAALSAYTMFANEKFDLLLSELIEKTERTPEEREIEKVIAEAEGDELIKLMRKRMAGILKLLLQRKLIENQTDLAEKIKEKSISTMNDTFIENALFFFMGCDENPHDWIKAEYKNFRSEYFKSMLCLILGIRGEQRDIFFLIKESERFEEDFPNETFDQGPYLAVMHLARKYL